MINIAIFASGRGSNALSILKYIKKHHDINVSLIVSNKPHAGVLEIAKEQNIEAIVRTHEDINHPQSFIKTLNSKKIDLIVLAGYLKRISPEMVNEFAIINIHPALLPKYGGKGMYGHYVHEAVKQAQDSKSGITIHWVDDNYDEGKIIFQKSCAISSSDTIDDIAKKVLRLEHHYYPEIVVNIAKMLEEAKK